MINSLAGCWAKLDRAKESIDNLNSEITNFLKLNSTYTTSGRHQKNGVGITENNEMRLWSRFLYRQTWCQ